MFHTQEGKQHLQGMKLIQSLLIRNEGKAGGKKHLGKDQKRCKFILDGFMGKWLYLQVKGFSSEDLHKQRDCEVIDPDIFSP